MPEFNIEHVMLKYLMNHRGGCGQRSNKERLSVNTTDRCARMQGRTFYTEPFPPVINTTNDSKISLW